jgi:hypothetical protein
LCYYFIVTEFFPPRFHETGPDRREQTALYFAALLEKYISITSLSDSEPYQKYIESATQELVVSGKEVEVPLAVFSLASSYDEHKRHIGETLDVYVPIDEMNDFSSGIDWLKSHRSHDVSLAGRFSIVTVNPRHDVSYSRIITDFGYARYTGFPERGRLTHRGGRNFISKLTEKTRTYVPISTPRG